MEKVGNGELREKTRGPGCEAIITRKVLAKVD
jgi:hypothetical protein